jgi:hypothetical protein
MENLNTENIEVNNELVDLNDELIDLEDDNISYNPANSKYKDGLTDDDQINSNIKKYMSNAQKEEKDIKHALGCLKLVISYDNYEEKIKIDDAKLIFENQTAHNIKNNQDNIFKCIVESQDLVEQFFYNKHKDVNVCKIMGKLRENNSFFVKTNMSSRNSELINVDFKFRNGYFQTNWNNINVTNVDYYQFIKKLRQTIVTYYKRKRNTNALVRPPEYLLFDLKAFEAKNN